MSVRPSNDPSKRPSSSFDKEVATGQVSSYRFDTVLLYPRKPITPTLLFSSGSERVLDMPPKIKEENNKIGTPKTTRFPVTFLTAFIKTERILRNGSSKTHPDRLTGRPERLMGIAVDPSDSFRLQIAPFARPSSTMRSTFTDTASTDGITDRSSGIVPIRATLITSATS